ncbi:MAG: DUF2281 domain-containing protein [Smithella sp.]|nr:DUF2281 domain-containing protein [Smithella sp.]
MTSKDIETKIERLPDDIKREVYDYIEFLAKKYRRSCGKPGKIQYQWQGSLSGLKTTAVDLQHKAGEWR